MELTEEEKNYRAICSRVTLQSKKEGFFKQLADSLAPHVNFGVFILCSTDVERFKTVAAACWEHINAELIFRGKNAEASVQKRLEGNNFFANNDFKRAYLCYCQSLIQAPVGPELISAYSNRSALLFRLCEYQAAIDDAEQAISYGSPEDTKHKLYERMTSCYIALKNYQKAKVTARLAKHLVEKHDPSNDKLLKKIEKHEAAIEAAIKDGKSSSTPPQHNNLDDSLQLPEGISITSPSPVFARASRKLKIEFDEDLGRFAQAQEKFSPGEVVLCEEPYASCLNIERMGSHCTHCFIRAKTPIPCETCSHVVFCSRKCRKDAMESYHRYECKVMALLMGSGMSPGSYLSFRIITQGSVEKFKEIFMDLELDPTRVILDPDTGKFDHRSYLNVFNLGGLEEYRTHIDMYERTLMAVFLTKCLRLNEYFQINLFKNPKPTEDEIMIGSLILRNLQVVQFNAYEACEFLMDSRTSYRKTTTSSVGIAIYTTASYFNHSCAPDVTRYFKGKTMIVQAIRGIEAKEPIYDNYGPLFIKMERRDRIRNLKGRYWFTCECIACRNNYPLLTQFPMEIVETENDLEERRALKKLINLDKTYFDEGVKAMESGKPRVAIELYKKYIEEYEALTVLQEGKFANNPYKTVLLVQEGLKLCLCTLGSVHVAGEEKLI